MKKSQYIGMHTPQPSDKCMDWFLPREIERVELDVMAVAVRQTSYIPEKKAFS